jgi:predicted ATPase
MKRIVLTGGPSCGKTSLIEYFSSLGYNCLREVAREILSERNQNEPTKSEWYIRQKLIYERQLAREECLTKGINFLDRGVNDNLGYSTFFHGDRLDFFDKNLLSNRYNLIFSLDRLPLVSDGLRWEGEEEAKRIHELVLESYTSFGYKLIKVPVFTCETLQDSIRKRAEFILKRVGGKR